MKGHTYDHGIGDICKKEGCGKVHIDYFRGKKHTDKTKGNISQKLKDMFKTGLIPKSRVILSNENLQKLQLELESLWLNNQLLIVDIAKKLQFGIIGTTYEKLDVHHVGYYARKFHFPNRTTDNHIINGGHCFHGGHGDWSKGLTKDTDPRVMKISVAMSGREVSLITRQKMSVAMTGNKGNEKSWVIRREKYGKDGFKNGSPFNDPAVWEKIVKSLHPSSIERILQEKLTFMNIPFTKQKSIKLSKAYHRVDLFIEPNICIEADGDFYHGCPIHKPGSYLVFGKPIEGIRRRDIQITAELEQHGYIVLRFWEHDIHNNLELCIKKICNVMTSQTVTQ